METNDKIERLMDMTERPEKYSEKEMDKLLEDKECREYYELMVKTDNAYTELPDIDTEKTLCEFEARHIHNFSWRKIAAIFIGIIVVSGITYAAIIISKHVSESQSGIQLQTASTVVKNVNDHQAETLDTVREKEKVFDNVELQTVINDISSYYKLDVVYHSEKSRHLRLHFRWDKTKNAEKTVGLLNHFENVNITLIDCKIEVQ